MAHVVKPETLQWEQTKIQGFSSKQLVEMPNGGLKLIKVEPASSYPLHHHPDKTEYIYVLEGNPEIVIGDDTHQGNEGEFFILPQAVSHAIINKSDKACKLLIGAIKM